MNVAEGNNFIPMAIIGFLFFIFGFVTWQNGALVPYLQMVCQLSDTQAMMVASVFYVAYTVMALPSSILLEKIGYKNGIAVGLLTLSVGFLIFIPAANTQEFSLFLVAQFIIGSGLTVLQTAANPYVVKVGPAKSAAVRIMYMGLMNKGAGVIVPVVFTAVVIGELSGVTAVSLAAMSDIDRTTTIAMLADGLILPYLWMAVAFVVLSALMRVAPLPELDNVNDEEGGESLDGTKKSILHFPQLILGAVAIFVYIGAEVIAGDTIGLFASNLGIANATSLTSYTMAFMLIGYALGILFIPRFISQEKALTLSAISGLIFSLCVVFSNTESVYVSSFLWGWSGIPTLPDTITFIALLGFSNALVWPAVWPLALSGLGSFTSKGSALLIMGISGGAVLSMVYTVLSESFDGQSAYWIMLPIYAFILFYSLKGHKMRSWTSKK